MVFTEEDKIFIKRIPKFNLLTTSRFPNKRFQHEIISIQQCIDFEKKKDRVVSFANVEPKYISYEIQPNNSLSFNILFKNKYMLHFKIKINNEYPFRCPECYLYDSSEYKTHLRELSTGNTCFCCNTLLCRNNWRANFNISMLIEEINTNVGHIYDTVYEMLETKIYGKYLGYEI